MRTPDLTSDYFPERAFFRLELLELCCGLGMRRLAKATKRRDIQYMAYFEDLILRFKLFPKMDRINAMRVSNCNYNVWDQSKHSFD